MRTKSFLPLTAWVLALSLFLSGCSLSPDGGETQSAPETGSAEQSVSENSGGSSSSQSSQNQTPRDLSGLKLSILGDSISTFDGYIPTDYNIFYPGSGDISTVEKTWWWQVMNATGMELNANASSSNTTITGDSLDTTGSAPGCSTKRMQWQQQRNCCSRPCLRACIQLLFAAALPPADTTRLSNCTRSLLL